MSALHDATTQTQEYAARIGLDWADKTHFWSMRTTDGPLQRGQLDNTPEAIEIWAAELAQRFGGRPVAVALEQARGAVIVKGFISFAAQRSRVVERLRRRAIDETAQ